MRRWLGWVLIAAAVLVAAYAVFSAPTDEERITEILEQLAAGVDSSEEQSNPVARLAHVNRHFKEVFTEDVRFRIPELTSGKTGRKSLTQLAVRAAAYYSTIDLEFKNVDIDIEDSASRATVTVDARLIAVGSQGPRRESRRVEFGFVNLEDEWRIESIRTLDDDEES